MYQREALEKSICFAKPAILSSWFQATIQVHKKFCSSLLFAKITSRTHHSEPLDLRKRLKPGEGKCLECCVSPRARWLAEARAHSHANGTAQWPSDTPRKYHYQGGMDGRSQRLHHDDWADFNQKSGRTIFDCLCCGVGLSGYPESLKLWLVENTMGVSEDTTAYAATGTDLEAWSWTTKCSSIEHSVYYCFV